VRERPHLSADRFMASDAPQPRTSTVLPQTMNRRLPGGVSTDSAGRGPIGPIAIMLLRRPPQASSVPLSPPLVYACITSGLG
jgi:hypothetical protein